MASWRQISAFLSLIFVLTWETSAAEHPVKLAGQARFDLLANDAVGELTGGEVLGGTANVERMDWIAEKDQPRGYMVSGAVSHRGWREWRVRFVPKNSGQVTLSLRGPWEESSPGGSIYKMETLWDGFEAQGTRLENGSFEEVQDNSPVGWNSLGGIVETVGTELSASHGQRVARTWHNGGFSTEMKVTRGKPVELRVQVRAVRPDNFVEMQRIAGHESPAHRAIQRFQRGVNFGNDLEAPKGQDWGAKYSADDFDHVKAEGFDHVRLPIAWQHYASRSDFKLSDEIFEKVDFLVAEAVKRKLGVLIDIHHYDNFTTKPADHKENFLKLWKQIAEHYANQPELVAFELLNEPKDAATTDLLNPLFAEAITLIRRTNPQRTIFVATGKWNSVWELSNLRLPDNDDNLIVTVHCYEPFYFTHQGATFAGPDVKVTGIRFPGPPTKPLEIDPALKVNSSVTDWVRRYNTLPAGSNPCSSAILKAHVKEASEWSAYFGRPIHFGEFGCFNTADAESRANYYREFREAFDAAHIGWAVWDWKAGFHYWDDKSNSPAPGMREALFLKK